MLAQKKHYAYICINKIIFQRSIEIYLECQSGTVFSSASLAERFPTCQVRVFRFYVSDAAPRRLPSLLLFALRLCNLFSTTFSRLVSVWPTLDLTTLLVKPSSFTFQPLLRNLSCHSSLLRSLPRASF